MTNISDPLTRSHSWMKIAVLSLPQMIRQYEFGTTISQWLSSILPNPTCIRCLPSLFIPIVRVFRAADKGVPLTCGSADFKTGKWFAAQSLDNQILIYSADNFRQNRKKRFAGHSVAGYACQVGFSPDGRWISSGDAEGNVVFWDWKNGRIKNRLRCHSKVVIAHEWLPHETVRSFLRLICKDSDNSFTARSQK